MQVASLERLPRGEQMCALVGTTSAAVEEPSMADVGRNDPCPWRQREEVQALPSARRRGGAGAASSTSRWQRLYFFPLPPRTRIVATDVGHARFLYRGAGCSDKRTHLLASRQPLKACHLHLAQLY